MPDNLVGVRDYLKKKGRKNKNIGWQDNQVTLGGQPLLEPGEVRGGQSFAAPSAIDKALDSYSSGAGQLASVPQTNRTIFGGASDEAPEGTVPIRQNLMQRGYSNEDIGWNDGLVTLGENVAIQPEANIAGTTYAEPGTISAALQGSGYQSPAIQQREQSLESMMERINQPFEYDPAQDPRYQAYQELAQARAEEATNRAMEQMNQRGILNSTVMGDRAAEIQQDAEQQALAQVPQFYQQAWQQRQQGIQNLGTIYDMLNRQAMQNAELTGYLNGMPTMTREQFEYGQEQDSIQNMLRRAQMTGMLEGEPTLQMRQWQASPEAQDWYLPLTRQELQAGIAAQQRAANRPYYKPDDAQEQYVNSLYQKLQSGEELTPQERQVLGLDSGSGGTGASMEDVISMAQSDPQYKMATTQEERQEIIDYYAGLLGIGTTGGNAGGGGTGIDQVQQMIDQAKRNGYSDQEIREALQQQGVDPSNYGY